MTFIANITGILTDFMFDHDPTHRKKSFLKRKDIPDLLFYDFPPPILIPFINIIIP